MVATKKIVSDNFYKSESPSEKAKSTPCSSMMTSVKGKDNVTKIVAKTYGDTDGNSKRQ